MDLEFADHIETQCAGLRSECEQLTGEYRMSSTQIDELVEARRAKYAALDFNGRVAEVTNNFILNWPGGWNRGLVDQGYSKGNLCADTKFINDLDGIIAEKGYTDKIPLVLDNKSRLDDNTRTERMLIIADVYLAMRELGWERYPMTA